MTYAQALSGRALGGSGGNWRSLISVVASSEALRTNRPEPQ
jgi:hypothetical protein